LPLLRQSILLAAASKRNARNARNASDCVWMETGLEAKAKEK